MSKITPIFKILFLTLTTFSAIVIALSIGGVPIPLIDVLAVLSQQIFGGFPQVDLSENTINIIWHLRLPRVLLSTIIGATMAISGTIMQAVLRNPLASSYTLGVSSSAGVGMVVLIVFGVSFNGLLVLVFPFLAVISGLLTLALIVWLASRIGFDHQGHALILIGIAIAIFSNALMTTVAARHSNYAVRLAQWQLGSFALRGWLPVIFLAIVLIIVMPLIMYYTPEMDLLTFGDAQAKITGVNVHAIKIVLLISATVLTGFSVAFVGIIGFVDLIAPHTARRLVGAKNRLVIPTAALIGATLTVTADLIARSILPNAELPVGTVTALIGAPFFIYLFLHGVRRRRSL